MSRLPGSGGTRNDPPETPSLFALSDFTVDDFPDEIYDPPPPPPRAFVHRTIAVSGPAGVNNTVEFPWYWSRLDHRHLDGNPGAIISVTPHGVIEINTVTSTASLRHDPHPVGVLYRFGHWYIYNLKLEAMPHGALFNVVIEERYR
jgi:hypothetical protein